MHMFHSEGKLQDCVDQLFYFEKSCLKTCFFASSKAWQCAVSHEQLGGCPVVRVQSAQPELGTQPESQMLSQRGWLQGLCRLWA